MKLQSLAIIFIIIIMPISLILSEYISNLIDTKEIEMEYNTRLLNSTYDAIKAYQLNTVNNAFGDVTTQKVDDVEAAAETFLNSLTSSFNYSGYDSHVMQEYVPAIVFTMYDGYYIYSPFTNVLTEVKSIEDDPTSYDNTYSKNGEIRDGLKPYVYYNCRYRIDDDNEFVITYTLDNYITIQGKIKGEYIFDYGYLYSINNDNGIEFNSSTNTYKYNGITFSESDTEELKEYVGNTEYSYAKINGKKYYLDPNYFNDRNEDFNINYQGRDITINSKAGIFYIDKDGKKNYNQTKGYSGSNLDDENKTFIKYYLAIKYNKSAFEYFKCAYQFSKMVLGGGGVSNYKDKAGNGALASTGYGLENLWTSNAVIYGTEEDKKDIYKNLSSDIVNISEYGNFKIFEGNIGQADSNFEQHRKAVIRYVIETNLATSIASFASTASAETEFTMPKISEKDWELIENDVCGIGFMQGLPIASKKYNGYAVVANTVTNEYVDEEDIYILVQDKNNTDNLLYCRPNDNGLIDNETYRIINKGDNVKKSINTFYSGIWNLNFEQKQDASSADETILYQPMSYKIDKESGGDKGEAYLGSYTSIMGTSALNPVGNTSSKYKDLYNYMSEKGTYDLKKAFYFGLARERWGAYNVNNINYELYNYSNGCEYFLNSYNF